MTCPACNQPLSHGINIAPGGKSEHILFCRHGTACPSYAMNDGATGDTEQAAYTKLEAAWLEEAEKLDEQEEHQEELL